MAISPFQIKSELEDDIILRETEKPCVPSRSATASRPTQSTNNTRNFVFPTTSVKDEPISFVNYSQVEEDNFEQYDSRNSTSNYNQSLKTPALLQRWSEENLNVDPTGDTSFLISSNSTSVSQQPLGGMRSSNSQSHLSESASTTRESRSSIGINTASLSKQGDKEDERRREAYAALQTQKLQTRNAERVKAEIELSDPQSGAKNESKSNQTTKNKPSQSVDAKCKTPKTSQKETKKQRLAIMAKRMKDKRSNPEFRERENKRQREAYQAKIAAKKGKTGKEIKQKKKEVVQHRKEMRKDPEYFKKELKRDNSSRKKRRQDPVYREMELMRDNFNRRVKRNDPEYKECEKMRDNMSRKLRRQDPEYVQVERMKDNSSRKLRRQDPEYGEVERLKNNSSIKYRRHVHDNDDNDDNADYEVSEIPHDLEREENSQLDNVDSRKDTEVAGSSQTL